MTNKKHTILNEKYRPNSLDTYICTEENKVKFQEFIDNQDIPHLLFAGKPGAGKTTLAKILVNNIDCDYLYINATDERSMDVMRDKVGKFASSGTFKPLKVVILDEATHILQASQVILLNMMETYSLTTRFILTGNYPERLIEPLRSRCQEFDLQPPTKKIIAKHIDSILNQENIEHTVDDIVMLVKKFYPDFRKIINNCQKYTINGVLKLDNLSGADNEYQDKILEQLMSKKPELNNIRQIIANSEVDEFTDLFRFLFDNLEKYSKGKDGEIIMEINTYQYYSNFRMDQEINIMCLISKILQILKYRITTNNQG
jgi:DNA polymerase III delta prime subunit